MSREVPLPPEFAWLAGRVHYVQRHSPREYSSSCPACGGEVHRSGEWPDRFRLFLDAKPLGWCRRCGELLFADQGENPPPKDVIEAWRKQQIEREEERKRSAERALAHLRSARLWETYYAQVEGAGRAYWRAAGIPDSYADYLQLGWCPMKRFWRDGAAFDTPTATIPMFEPGWTCRNVMHRLIDAKDGDKYRPEIAGQGQLLYYTDPDLDLTDNTVLVEGAKKATVTKIMLDDAATCVVGLPGTALNADNVARLAGPGRLTLIMDPDARAQAWRLCEALGKARCRVVLPPMKVDDGILAARLSTREVRGLLREAVRAG